MSWHGDWKKIKAKGKKLPSDFFPDGFGKALDDFQDAEEAYNKNKDPDKDDKLQKKIVDAAKAMGKVYRAYVKKLDEAVKGDDEKVAEQAQAVMDAGVAFMNTINVTLKKYKA